jgi:predicted metal-binding protein
MDDQASGVPAGAWEVRVPAGASGSAEALIAMQAARNESAQLDESHELDLVTVFRSAGASGEMEAMSIKSMLESNGVEAVLVGDSRFPNFPEEVRVAKDHVTRAKRLIAEALAAGREGAAEAEASSEKKSRG